MRLTLLTLLSFLFLSLSGQNPKTDAVYKNDGSIFRGKIISSENNATTIETFCGNTLVINNSEITQIKSENYNPFHTLKEEGYYNYTSMGALVGSESDAKTTNFSFIMEHNYQFHKHFAVGVSTGIEWFNTSVMPLGLNIKIILPYEKQMAFYIGGTGGYSIPLEELVMDGYEIKETKGGWFINTDVGIIFPSIGRTSIYTAIGYRYQELGYVREDWWYDEVERLTTYNRFNFKIGVCLH